MLRFKYRTRYILFMVFIGCIGLVGINLTLKGNNYNAVRDNTSRIIIESSKKVTVPESKGTANDQGTRVTIPATDGKPTSPVQPLPIPDANAPIIISPLS